MTVLVVLTLVVVAILTVLVAGLLRSHAEILRSLHELGAGVGDPSEGPAAAAAPPRAPFETRAGVAPPRSTMLAGDGSAARGHDISGITPAGDATGVSVRVPGQTLVAFLSSTCSTCAHFWQAFAGPGPALPPGMRVVAVTKGEQEESLSAVRAVAPQHVPVVMSSEAWRDYEVPVSPYFVLVDGASGAVVGEGAATTWEQVAGLIGASAADARALQVAPVGPHGPMADRAARVDADLTAHGLLPGDPRLYPDSTPEVGR